MPRFRAAYPPEFRRQMVELVRSGRTPEELSREFEPTVTIVWPDALADHDGSPQVGGLAAHISKLI